MHLLIHSSMHPLIHSYTQLPTRINLSLVHVSTYSFTHIHPRTSSIMSYSFIHSFIHLLILSMFFRVCPNPGFHCKMAWLAAEMNMGACPQPIQNNKYNNNNQTSTRCLRSTWACPGPTKRLWKRNCKVYRRMREMGEWAIITLGISYLNYT